jgi:hypothetical protein
MKYYHFESAIAAEKTQFVLREESPSFCGTPPSSTPYIEPAFEKVIWETEHPTIILVSAVGAAGKTALAQQLSRDTGLPLLDLAKHRHVGDKSLTGQLTEAFQVADLSAVFGSIATGAYGVIIDGVDEGRSKTKSFLSMGTVIT